MKKISKIIKTRQKTNMANIISRNSRKNRNSEKSKLTRALAIVAAMLMIMANLAACSGGSGDTALGGSEGSSGAEALAAISEFATVDLDGNEVTQAVFADAKITMINFWGTYCGPCIKELPELQEISRKYEGEAQVIGVPIDVNFSAKDSAEYKSAIKYLEEAGADYMNIQPAGGISEYMETMQYVPTSIFVDSEGKIIGAPVTGAMPEEYKARIEDYLD